MQGRFNNGKSYVGRMNFPGFCKAADGKKVLNMGLDVYWLSRIPAVERVKEFANRNWVGRLPAIFDVGYLEIPIGFQTFKLPGPF